MSIKVNQGQAMPINVKSRSSNVNQGLAMSMPSNVNQGQAMSIKVSGTSNANQCQSMSIKV